MTTLDKIDMGASILRTNQVEATKALQGRQEIAAQGKSAPVTKPVGTPSEDKKKELDQAVKNLSGYVQNVTRELNFSIDEELHRPVVTVLDKETGEVIRQIPTEEMLELSKHVSESQEKLPSAGLKGVLFRGDA